MARIGNFANVEELPPDAIFFTKQRFKEDSSSTKYNLGIGAFRTKYGKPYVLDIVRKVEKELASDTSIDKEYFPIGGNQTFIENAQNLILSKETRNNWLNKGYNIAGVQSLSGTGALRILMNYISNINKSLNLNSIIWISNPTWGNHKKIINKCKLKLKLYPYWDPINKNLDLNNMLNTLKYNTKKGDYILLHSCAHNPTGVDPTKEQWKKIFNVIKNKQLIPFFDCAYQGFATGSLADDSFAVRYFAENGSEMLIAQSFSKNLGLYNERIGCATVLCKDKLTAKAINTQLCSIIRPMYSNPPSHGAYIVNKILSNSYNFNLWNKEMNKMSNQIREARRQLFILLTRRFNTPGNWEHITNQIGMFCFSGLNKLQVKRLENIHHVYMLSNGRISMAGVSPSDYKFDEDNNYNNKYINNISNGKTKGNVEYIAKAIDEVVRYDNYQIQAKL